MRGAGPAPPRRAGCGDSGVQGWAAGEGTWAPGQVQGGAPRGGSEPPPPSWGTERRPLAGAAAPPKACECAEVSAPDPALPTAARICGRGWPRPQALLGGCGRHPSHSVIAVCRSSGGEPWRPQPAWRGQRSWGGPHLLAGTCRGHVQALCGGAGLGGAPGTRAGGRAGRGFPALRGGARHTPAPGSGGCQVLSGWGGGGQPVGPQPGLGRGHWRRPCGQEAGFPPGLGV